MTFPTLQHEQLASLARLRTRQFHLPASDCFVSHASTLTCVYLFQKYFCPQIVCFWDFKKLPATGPSLQAFSAHGKERVRYFTSMIYVI